MSKKYIVISIFLFPLLFSIAYSQNKEITFDCLNTDDGLSHAVITSIFKDSQGFMWFGTQDGLNKYDGYEFTIYKTIPFDTTSLTDNWILSLNEDSENNLWVGTHSGGLFKFNRGSRSFINFKNNSKDKKSLSGNTVWTIFLSDSKELFVGTAEGLSIFNQAEQNFENIFFEIDKTNYAVNSIYQDDEGNYWIGTWGGGLFKMNPQKEIVANFRFHQKAPYNYRRNKIKSIVQVKDGNLLLATDGGLVQLNPENENYTSDYFGINKSLLSLLFYDDSELWIGTHHDGLLFVDTETGLVSNLQHSEEENICDNWIQKIYKDETDIIWLATGNGLSRFIPYMNNFNFIVNNPKKPEGLSSNEITDIAIDKKNNIWISTWNGGLNKYNPATKTFQHYRSEEGDKTSIPNDIVWTMTEDSEGNLWLGTYSGLSKFDSAKNQFLTYVNANSDSTSLSHSNVSAIHEDEKGDLWIGTWGGGLNKFDKSTETFVSYKNIPDVPSSLSNNLVTSLNSDSERLFIGTKGGGLNLFDYKTGKFHRFINDPQNPSSLSDNNVLTIYIDNADDVWIGTWGGGLNKFDVENGSFTHITESEGLTNNVINSIIEDDEKNLWLSTNKGISRYNTENGSIINYEKEDGLKNDQFTTSAKLPNGSLIFGGSNGLVYFDPSEISINKHPPEIVFTSFKILNKELKRDFDLNSIDEIVLDHNQNAMTIEFAALDFTRPQKNKYAYKLEGFHEEWIDNNSDREVNFMNLSPGEYTLKVRASNNDNVWNKEGASLAFVIVPPFWQTWWFQSLLALLLIGGILSAYLWRIRIIESQKLKLENLVSLRTSELQNEIEIRQHTEEALRRSEASLKETNANKDKFFSIISHDLKSPFSSLLGFSEYLVTDYDELSDGDKKEAIVTMNTNVKKIFSLTENLLNWSRIQTGKIEYKPEEINLYELIDNLLNVLKINAEPKNIELINEVCSEAKAYADPNMIGSIVRNLVLNAIKFSYPASRVILRSENGSEFVKIKVIDEGIGIHEEDLNKLFKIEHHHTTNGTSEEKGTGLGLILCKELVEKNKGEIYVESEVGTGTTFTFTLPVRNSEVQTVK